MVEEYRILISDETKFELREIVKYINEKGYPETSKKVKNRILSKITSLKTNPQRFSEYKPMTSAAIKFRSFTVWDYVVVYRVYKIEKVVVVIDLFHGARKK